MTGSHDAERVLDVFLAPEHDQLADRVIDAALTEIARTPQRRALRVSWRFPQMTPIVRFAVVAVLLVAVVGTGGALLFSRSANLGPGGPPLPTATPAPTPTPTTAPTPQPSEVAPGITGWTPYTSEAYGFEMSYPSSWTIDTRATPGDPSSADVFANNEGLDGDQIGLSVSEEPVGRGANPASLAGLKAWARSFCIATSATRDGGAAACDGWTDQAIPMCYAAGGNLCRAAIIVPDAGSVSAFFEDWNSTITGPAVIRAVSIGRPDLFPAAARYGGAVELLKSILGEMDVVAPRPGQVPGS